MAADDSIDSPASYVQRSVKRSGSAAAATPVRRASPRNWFQFAAVGVCADTRTDTRRMQRTAFRPSRSARRLFRACMSGQREELIAIVQEQRAVRGHWRGIYGAAHVHLAEDFLFLARLQDGDVAVLVAQIHLAIDHQRRTPDGGEHVVRPVLLTGLRVETVQEAAEVGHVQEAVDDGCRRNRSADLVELPHLAALRDVAALGGVDAIEVADALTVLRILAVADVHAVLVDDRRGDQFVPRFRPDRVLRIRVELPELLAGRRLVAAHPAVAL